jgi:uncharacterized protein
VKQIPETIRSWLAQMRPIVARFPQIAAAWLFGSAARGELRIESDVDIGLLLVDPAATAADEYLMLGELAARLESVVAPRLIDLVLLEPQGPVFAHEALIDGHLILEQDRERRVEFEANTMVRAFDFRPTWEMARKGQIAAIRRSLRGRR